MCLVQRSVFTRSGIFNVYVIFLLLRYLISCIPFFSPKLYFNYMVKSWIIIKFNKTTTFYLLLSFEFVSLFIYNHKSIPFVSLENFHRLLYDLCHQTNLLQHQIKIFLILVKSLLNLSSLFFYVAVDWLTILTPIANNNSMSIRIESELYRFYRNTALYPKRLSFKTFLFFKTLITREIVMVYNQILAWRQRCIMAVAGAVQCPTILLQ